MSQNRSLYALYREGISLLTEGGMEEAASDVWLLFESVFGVTKAELFARPEALPAPGQEERFFSLLERRLAHEPVQYLTGEAPFFGEMFAVSSDTLIPRMDTEVLVEEALSFARQRWQERAGVGTKGKNSEEKNSEDKDSEPFSILDLCTGTGCVLLSLLKDHPSWEGIGTDVSPGALAVAGENAGRLGASGSGPSGSAAFYEGDLFGALDTSALSGKRFDLITANPPYIASGVIPTLQEEVRCHEPALALDGGEDGLLFYRRILARAGEFLKPGGGLFFEIGFDQGEAVLALCREAGFSGAALKRDLAGKDRVVLCLWDPENVQRTETFAGR